ncbi:MAG: O-succinylhomoserine sulfhydrylase [Actinomycetota bacterium]|nr:O-succinylhomoserine sulfhydrylase [Actinomycetota bacterium]
MTRPRDRDAERRWRPDTQAVRGGLERSPFGETSEALHLTSGFVYGSADEAFGAFSGDNDHHRYTRLGNPTLDVLEERLALLEGGEAARTTASGMSAVFNALASMLRAGDRVVASRALFGSCFQVLTSILPRWGVVTDLIDGHDLAQWEAALARPAKVVFFETPSNPMQELVDVTAVCDLAHAAGARVIVDNIFTTPVLQRPLDLGADVVVYSTTKHMDGHGRTLGGAIIGPAAYVESELNPLLQHTGPTMSPFSAWVVLKGLETLRMRVERMTASALDLAGWLETQPGVRFVRHPWLASHPQHALARAQMSGGGSIVTFELDGGRERAFALLDALRLIDLSNNLGDSRSLAIHPATTTHLRIGAQERERTGISEGVIRLSIGLEDIEDLRDDLAAALSAASAR